MSSRHQSRRRRAYGRREHEVRERRQREYAAHADERFDVGEDATRVGVPVAGVRWIAVPVRADVRDARPRVFASPAPIADHLDSRGRDAA